MAASAPTERMAQILGVPFTAKGDVPENRHTLLERMARIAVVDKAGKLMGREALADAIATPVRTMRSYTTAERGMPDVVLIMTARALRKHAAAAIEQAERIEAMLAGDAE